VTIVFDDKADEPRTHALVIGVGTYHHLPGGDGEPLKKDFGLTQLRSPPISAREITSWLLNCLNNPAAPLGSVDLLLSPAQNLEFRDGRQVPIEDATMSNSFRAQLQHRFDRRLHRERVWRVV
jgi:hypothetical protein